jgi:hypothetical protein
VRNPNDIKIIHSHKPTKKNLPCGWLLPNEFIKVKWGNHEKWAGEYILSDEKLIEEDEQFEEKYFNYLSKDFLISCKNFILLNSPCDDDELFISYNSKVKPTTFQKNFIVDLLIKISDKDALNKFIEDVEE